VQGLRVLVVDDEADARELTAFVLQSSGAYVETVDCASEALRRLDADRFDVVVSDISMPEMDGYALARELRSKPYAPGILALTSFASEQDRRYAFAAGFDEHLAKTVDTETLCTVVAALGSAVRTAAPRR